MRADFGGSGLHWRVLPLSPLDGAVIGHVGNGPRQRTVRLGRASGLWQVYRRTWDHWEAIDPPYMSQNGAMTRANYLARLHRG